jgi:hypothetical protein
VRWVLSPVDCRVHLLVPAGDLPWGVLKARCGQMLPSGSPHHERPPWGAHRTCPTCALIAQRPTSVPADRWVSPQDTAEGQAVPAAGGRPNVTRVMWVRCRVDEQLHLINPRAALRLAGGCAVAWCGALLVLQDVALRGAGTPCSTCLVVGSA